MDVDSNGYAQFYTTRNSNSGFFTGPEAYMKGTSLYLMTGTTTSRTSRMYISNAGNVGIGDNVGISTANGWYPDKKLHVKHGSIEIEENSGDLATDPYLS